MQANLAAVRIRARKVFEEAQQICLSAIADFAPPLTDPTMVNYKSPFSQVLKINFDEKLPMKKNEQVRCVGFDSKSTNGCYKKVVGYGFVVQSELDAANVLKMIKA